MNQYRVTEKIAALISLTIIAVFAMLRITEPDNIIINIVVAIAAFITGGGMRKGDNPAQ